MTEVKTGTVAVTGHRPQHLSAEDSLWIIGEFERLMVKLSPSVAISGMALGADTWWAQAAPGSARTGTRLRAVPEQDSRWRASDRKIYKDLLSRAAEITVVCPGYNPSALSCVIEPWSTAATCW